MLHPLHECAHTCTYGFVATFGPLEHERRGASCKPFLRLALLRVSPLARESQRWSRKQNVALRRMRCLAEQPDTHICRPKETPCPKGASSPGGAGAGQFQKWSRNLWGCEFFASSAPEVVSSQNDAHVLKANYLLDFSWQSWGLHPRGKLSPVKSASTDVGDRSENTAQVTAFRAGPEGKKKN